MSNPDAAIVAVCVKLQFILKTVWIVKIAALIFVSLLGRQRFYPVALRLPREACQLTATRGPTSA